MTTLSRLRSVVMTANRLDNPDISNEALNSIRKYLAVLMASVEATGDEPDGILTRLLYSTLTMVDVIVGRRDGDDDWTDKEWLAKYRARVQEEWAADRADAEKKLNGKPIRTVV